MWLLGVIFTQHPRPPNTMASPPGEKRTQVGTPKFLKSWKKNKSHRNPWDWRINLPTFTIVGRFNPFEKYLSQIGSWILSPGRGENKKYLKPPPNLPNKFGKKQAKFFFGRCFCPDKFFRPAFSQLIFSVICWLTMIANISAGQLESYFTKLDRGFPLLNYLGAQVVWGRCNLNIWINGACHIGFFSSAYHSSDSSYTVPKTFLKRTEPRQSFWSHFPFIKTWIHHNNFCF